VKKYTLLTLILAIIPIYAAEISFVDSTVSAEGFATAYVLPDMAVINFTLEIRESRMGNLFNQAMKVAEGLSAELKKAGVEEPLTIEGGGSIYSELDWQSERIEHELSVNLRCVVEDLGKLDKAVDIIYAYPSDEPGQKTSFYDVTYGVKDPSIYLDELSGKAIADAREDANTLAQAHGKTLGDIIVLSESPPWVGYSWGYTSEWDFSAEDLAGSSKLPRVSVGYSVMVTYELK